MGNYNCKECIDKDYSVMNEMLLNNTSSYNKESNQENSQAGIVWDNKTIEEHYLERKLHPRTKIDEPKTPYPDIAEGVLQEGDKDNEVKHTEEILNNVVDSLNDKDKNKSNTKDLKKKAYSNEYTAALKFYNENKDKYEDFSGERKMSLENALINKFQNHVIIIFFKN